MSVVERLADLQYRALDRARHAGAFEVAREAGTATSFASLRGARQCLLVTFRRSGEARNRAMWGRNVLPLNPVASITLDQEPPASRIESARRTWSMSASGRCGDLQAWRRNSSSV